MLTVTKAIFLALIQAITEWLPISSSGHLVLFQELFGLKDQIAFDLLLHVATLFVVVFIFRKDIINIIFAFLRGLRELYFHRSWKKFSEEENVRLGLFVIVGTIPIVIIGLSLRDLVEQAFSNLLYVAIAFIFTGFLLWLTKYKVSKFASHKGYGVKDMKFKDAFLVGLFQSVAIFPGVSRSGSTIAGGMITGFERNLAAKFSFLLFIPAILGATILQLNDFVISEAQIVPYIVGFVVAAAASYFVIETLLALVRKGKLHLFSYYCWFIGIVTLVIYFLG